MRRVRRSTRINYFLKDQEAAAVILMIIYNFFTKKKKTTNKTGTEKTSEILMWTNFDTKCNLMKKEQRYICL